MKSRPSRTLRALRWILMPILVIVLAAVVSGWIALRGSLAATSGSIEVPGLAAETTVELDSLGIPTIHSSSREDAARALGFLHGQERFFQMDLMRRQPAGELSELVGDRALEVDRGLRVHRFRARARAVLDASPPDERAMLEAYAEGVNAGLSALSVRPFEYLLLRATPRPWAAEDSFLVSSAMFLDLQDESGSHESSFGVLHDVMPQQMFEFLVPHGTDWDVPLDHSTVPITSIPGPDVFDLRHSSRSIERPDAARLDPSSETWLGSNGFAISGQPTGNRSLLAGDMHLGINVPIIWYRASIDIPDAELGRRRITGITLPGAPTIVTGSNGEVAWTFTNSYGDWGDLIVLQMIDSRHYMTPDGPRELETFDEKILTPEGSDTLTVDETIWGPVIDEDHNGNPRALRWVAHEVEGTNMAMAGLWTASNLQEAFDVAASSGIPHQNFVAADSSGHIGWTIMGRIPRRSQDIDFRLPVSSSDAEARWSGWLEPSEVPRIIDPSGMRIWTANNRIVGGNDLAIIGDGGYAFGARARQIRDDLDRLDSAKEPDLLAIQLDDRAVFIQRWRDLLIATLSTAEGRQSDAAAMLPFLEHWDARASIDSQGFRFARAFRSFTETIVFEAITKSALDADPRFRWRHLPQREHALWALVSQKPAHLLPGGLQSWDEVLLEAADQTFTEMTKDGRRLEDATWGQRNESRFRHPLAGAIPLLGNYLEYPRHELPGDWDMPRAQDPTNGASQRMVVSPGDEAHGIFHMPGGQSGHPLSPHFSDGHQAWVEGKPTPFLPGPAVTTIRLVPPGSKRP